ncbi:MAG: ATP-dependent metallopeptidase FtsH/Yme1/Tma family protein [Gemmatimonadales bacterium]|nr:MAG: ATP-dependent metallopeptidase FtsH/Yme1/Tma family protein [Gemmatimonadales bacterium]
MRTDPTPGSSGDRPTPPPDFVRRRRLIWVLILTGLFLWIWMPLLEREEWVPVDYTTFLEHVEEGRVERVLLEGDEIRATLADTVETEVPDLDEPVRYRRLSTWVPAMGDDRLLGLLDEQGVEIQTEPESDFSWWWIALYALPALFILFFFLYFIRRMQAQGQQMMSVGKSTAKSYERTDEATTFDDVAGQEAAKREVQELIAFLRDPSRFEKLGGEIPTGFLLVGPPGTGKTLLARAIAGEADVPFFHVSGSDFMEMLVGVGASRVRNLFEEAKSAAPSIVFIDELDSIGRKRGAGLGGGHDEREQTLNQLLSELDGFEPNSGVVVVAATNRPDVLDPALLRPGRFDRRITVDLPSVSARTEILKIHARQKPLDPDVELDQVARGTPGFSGADLRNLLNEAALLAARKERESISMTEIEDARDKILMGLEREGIVLTDGERRHLAYHEAGHAILAATLEHADPLHKVSIVPRGRAMGVTQQLPEKDRYLHSREELDDRLAVIMGGRAAEELVLETITSGAEDDLRQASNMARRMVLHWGMSESFGQVAPSGGREEVFLGEEIAQRRDYSDSTARELDTEVRRIIDEAYERAKAQLEEHRDALDALVEILLDEEEVDGDRVRELI